MPTDPPGGQGAEAWWRRLRQIERRAKQAGAGAWGLADPEH